MFHPERCLYFVLSCWSRDIAWVALIYHVWHSIHCFLGQDTIACTFFCDLLCFVDLEAAKIQFWSKSDCSNLQESSQSKPQLKNRIHYMHLDTTSTHQSKRPVIHLHETTTSTTGNIAGLSDEIRAKQLLKFGRQVCDAASSSHQLLTDWTSLSQTLLTSGKFSKTVSNFCNDPHSRKNW